MSINQMLLAMKARVGSSARKLVLIKLADNATDAGHCFPSYSNIADYCEMSKRSVIIHINKLESDGFLSKETRKTTTGNTSNSYYLSILTPSEDSALGSEDSALPLVKNLHPEPVTPLTSHLNNKKNKEKVDFSALKLSNEDLLEVLRIRKQNKGGVLSQRAVNGLGKEFEKARVMGFSNDDILTKWDVRGWKSFEASWLDSQKGYANGTHQNTGRKNAAESHHDTLKQIAEEADAREMGGCNF